MKKILAAVLTPAFLAVPAISSADSGSGCGLGQQIFAGQSGLGPHVLAATTNGTSSNQLFGITFDSLGCNSESIITAQYQRNLYVANNLDSIATDAARGGGNHLQSLAVLLEIAPEDQPAFYSLTQSRYTALFGNEEINSREWLTMLDQNMLTEPQLAKYVSQ
jgi:hypothetical protein